MFELRENKQGNLFNKYSVLVALLMLLLIPISGWAKGKGFGDAAGFFAEEELPFIVSSVSIDSSSTTTLSFSLESITSCEPTIVEFEYYDGSKWEKILRPNGQVNTAWVRPCENPFVTINALYTNQEFIEHGTGEFRILIRSYYDVSSQTVELEFIADSWSLLQIEVEGAIEGIEALSCEEQWELWIENNIYGSYAYEVLGYNPLFTGFADLTSLYQPSHSCPDDIFEGYVTGNVLFLPERLQELLLEEDAEGEPLYCPHLAVQDSVFSIYGWFLEGCGIEEYPHDLNWCWNIERELGVGRCFSAAAPAVEHFGATFSQPLTLEMIAENTNRELPTGTFEETTIHDTVAIRSNRRIDASTLYFGTFHTEEFSLKAIYDIVITLGFQDPIPGIDDVPPYTDQIGVIANDLTSAPGSCNNTASTLDAEDGTNPGSQEIVDAYVDDGSSETDPIDLVSGEFLTEAVDLELPGIAGNDFSWKRTYRSLNNDHLLGENEFGEAKSPMGNRWDHSYNIVFSAPEEQVYYENTPYELRIRFIDLQTGNGRIVRLFENIDDPGYFGKIYQSGISLQYIDGGISRAKFKNEGVWEFTPFRKISKIIDRFDSTVSFDYDLDGRLAKVIDTRSIEYTITNNPNGTIASVAVTRPVNFENGKHVPRIEFKYYSLTGNRQYDLEFVTQFGFDAPGGLGGHNLSGNWPAGHKWPRGKSLGYSYNGSSQIVEVYDSRGLDLARSADNSNTPPNFYPDNYLNPTVQRPDISKLYPTGFYSPEPTLGMPYMSMGYSGKAESLGMATAQWIGYNKGSGHNFPEDGRLINISYFNPKQDQNYVVHTSSDPEEPHQFVTPSFLQSAATISDSVEEAFEDNDTSEDQYNIPEYRTIVNDRRGHVREYYYNKFKKPIASIAYTGVSDKNYEPTNPAFVEGSKNLPENKLRPTDPDRYITRYLWNSNGQLRMVEKPNGNGIWFAYDKKGRLTQIRHRRGDYRPEDLAGNDIHAEVQQSYIRANWNRDDANEINDLNNDNFDQYRAIFEKFRYLEENDAEAAESYCSCTDLPEAHQDGEENITLYRYREGLKVRETLLGGNDTTYEDDIETHYEYNEQGQLVRKIYAPVDLVAETDDSFGLNSYETDLIDYHRVDEYVYYTSSDAPSVHQIGLLKEVIADSSTPYGHGIYNASDVPISITGNSHAINKTTLFTYNDLGFRESMQTIVLDETSTEITREKTEYVTNSFGEVLVTRVFGMNETGLLELLEETEIQIDGNGNTVLKRLANINPVNNMFVDFDESKYMYDVLDNPIEIREIIDPSDSAKDIVSRLEYDQNQNLVKTISAVAVDAQANEETSNPDYYNTMNFEYDERDLLYKSINAKSSGYETLEKYDYDGNGNLVRLRNETGGVIRATSYVYDHFDRIYSATDPMGNVQITSYNRLGDVTRTKLYGELGDVAGSDSNVLLEETFYNYDRFGRQIQEINSFFTYSPAGSRIDLGSTVTPEFWDINANDTVSFQSHIISSLEYDAVGNVTRTYDVQGASSYHRYDSLFREVIVEDEAGGIDTQNGNVTYTLFSDSWPNVHQSYVYLYDQVSTSLVSTPLVSSIEFDGMGRVWKAVDFKGTETTSKFDSKSNLLESASTGFVDVASSSSITQISRFSYDRKNRLIESKKLLDSNTLTWDTVFTSYDKASRAKYREDSSNAITTYYYDGLNRLTDVIHPNGKTYTNFYHSDGRLNSTVDAEGSTASYNYDALDRVISRVIVPHASSETIADSEIFEYDGLSRIISASDSDSIISREYTSLSTLTKDRLDYEGISSELNYTYLTNGFLKQIQYPSGLNIQYEYDPLSRMKLVKSDHSGTFKTVHAWEYAGASDSPSRRDFSSGISGSYSYDPEGRLSAVIFNHPTAMVDHGSGLEPWVHSIKTGFDGFGNLIEYQRTHMLTQDLSFEYDELNRINNTREGLLGRELSYSAAQMRDSETISEYDLADSLQPWNSSLSYSSDNDDDQHLIYETNSVDSTGSIDTNKFSSGLGLRVISALSGDYDENGRLVSRSEELELDRRWWMPGEILKGLNLVTYRKEPLSWENSYQYDFDGKLVKFSKKWDSLEHNGCDEVYDLSHKYDALGRRIATTLEHERPEESGTDILQVRSEIESIKYVNHGSSVVELSRSTNGGPQFTEQFIYGNHINEIVHWIIDGTQYDILTDHLYSVVGISPVSDVTLTDWVSYFLDGTVSNRTNFTTETAQFKFLFKGHYFDEISNLYYYRNRYLDVVTNTFITLDPLGLWGDSLNRGNGYAFVGNNPWSKSDPFGLMSGGLHGRYGGFVDDATATVTGVADWVGDTAYDVGNTIRAYAQPNTLMSAVEGMGGGLVAVGEGITGVRTGLVDHPHYDVSRMTGLVLRETEIALATASLGSAMQAARGARYLFLAGGYGAGIGHQTIQFGNHLQTRLGEVACGNYGGLVRDLALSLVFRGAAAGLGRSLSKGASRSMSAAQRGRGLARGTSGKRGAGPRAGHRVPKGSRAGSMMKGCNCFASGTIVQAEEGPVPIEEIEAGDQVWALDVESGDEVIANVVRAWATENATVLELTLSDGSKLVVTPDHPFYTLEGVWVEADELEVARSLRTLSDEHVWLVERQVLQDPRTVYNFEVAHAASYFVSSNGILVHNSSCGRKTQPTPAAKPKREDGYRPTDSPKRVPGNWTKEDLQRGINGHPPKSIGKEIELHHADQMPGSAIHEIPGALHRGRNLHPNKFNQGVTNSMRRSNRKLHWWYRAREEGADHFFPDEIYDNR